jgi:hypothetical protein
LPEKGTDCNFGQINLTMDSDTVHALCYFTWSPCFFSAEDHWWWLL